jgi:hypothetical protein
MVRMLIVGLWACLVTLGATYGGAYWRTRPSAERAEAHAEKLEARKIKPISVPIIAGGVLKGYVSAEFTYVGAAADKHDPGLDPESFVMDEAFRLIYADNKIDFSNVQKTDLNALTAQITANVNQRLGKTVLKETLVRNITFVAREDVPK